MLIKSMEVITMNYEAWLIIAIVIIIILLVIILRLLNNRRRRDEYNLEYPQDFQSSADQDMEDRFMGKHFK